MCHCATGHAHAAGPSHSTCGLRSTKQQRRPASANTCSGTANQPVLFAACCPTTCPQAAPCFHATCGCWKARMTQSTQRCGRWSRLLASQPSPELAHTCGQCISTRSHAERQEQYGQHSRTGVGAATCLIPTLLNMPQPSRLHPMTVMKKLTMKLQRQRPRHTCQFPHVQLRGPSRARWQPSKVLLTLGAFPHHGLTRSLIRTLLWQCASTCQQQAIKRNHRMSSCSECQFLQTLSTTELC